MTAFKIAYSCCFSLKNLDFLQKKFLTSTTAQTCGEYQQLGPILRLVQTYCVKRISLGCFLRMQKTQPIRKFSILLCKRMRFYAGLNKPLIGFFHSGNPSVGAAVKKSLWRHLFREIPPPPHLLFHFPVENNVFQTEIVLWHWNTQTPLATNTTEGFEMYF